MDRRKKVVITGTILVMIVAMVGIFAIAGPAVASHQDEDGTDGIVWHVDNADPPVVYGVHTSNGTVMEQHEVANVINHNLQVGDETIYTTAENEEEIFMYDRETGDQIFNQVFEGVNQNTVDIYENDLIFTHSPTGDTFLNRYDQQGNEVYSVSLETSTSLDVVRYHPQRLDVIDGVLYIAWDDQDDDTDINVISAYDLEDGSLLWENDVSNSAFNSHGGLDTSESNVFAANGDGEIVSVSKDDGSHEWTTQSLGGASVGGPSYDDGTVYLGTLGDIHAVDADTGDENWGVVSTGEPDALASVTDGVIYFDIDNDNLVKLNTEGTEEWNVNTEAISGSEFVEMYATNNIIFVGGGFTEPGMVTAYNINDGSVYNEGTHQGEDTHSASGPVFHASPVEEDEETETPTPTPTPTSTPIEDDTDGAGTADPFISLPVIGGVSQFQFAGIVMVPIVVIGSLLLYRRFQYEEISY